MPDSSHRVSKKTEGLVSIGGFTGNGELFASQRAFQVESGMPQKLLSSVHYRNGVWHSVRLALKLQSKATA